MDIIDKIRLFQQRHRPPHSREAPPHRPEMLYIGCIDARLDPIRDIGIPKGKALIYRNIGALVLPHSHTTAVQTSTHRQDQVEVPEYVSLGAALEFFLGRLAPRHEIVQHIVVAGHTDCGGIKAYCNGTFGDHELSLHRYLDSLTEVRQTIVRAAGDNGWSQEETLREFERESVRQSVRHLQTFPSVQTSLAKGKLQVHGWVVNTATQRIEQLDVNSGQFLPMAPGSSESSRLPNT